MFIANGCTGRLCMLLVFVVALVIVVCVCVSLFVFGCVACVCC